MNPIASQVVSTSVISTQPVYSPDYVSGMESLVLAVQELSLARDIETITRIVRETARSLNGADGATFVLREGEHCYYAEENAIAPLWKGQRFPMQTCISGWVMLNGQPAVIEDIYQDPRIPQDAYRPTFVKSLVMVPIREENPIGAIGNYWASHRMPTQEEIRLIQTLANTTAVALENVRLYNELEQRVQERTAQLEIANQELEAFSYSVSHDLRAPLRTIEGFSQAVLQGYSEHLDERGRHYLGRVHEGSVQMSQLIEDMLNLSRLTRGALHMEEQVNLSEIARDIAWEFQSQAPQRCVSFDFQPNVFAKGDRRLLQVVLQNLIGNAWKYTAKHTTACIQLGAFLQNAQWVYYVKDDGAGFDMQYADRLFGAFQRLHGTDEFEGTGIGLATVARIIHRHGGKIWAEATVEQGATFYFTLAACP